MADADDPRVGCLILGQQIGDNVADLAVLLNDYVPQPQTTVARDSLTLMSAYVARIHAEMDKAWKHCDLRRDMTISRRWDEFVRVWDSSSSPSEIREAFNDFHDALDRNQEEPSEF